MLHLARMLILAVLLIPAWIYGGVTPLVLHLSYGTIVLATIFTLLGRRTSSRTEPPKIWRWPIAVPWLLVILFIALQALNPSHRFEDTLKNLTYHEALPASVDAPHSWASLARLLAFGLLFWTTRQIFTSRKWVRRAALVLIVHGFAMALFAILESLGTHQASTNGPFINPNNFAAYLNLIWPITLAAGVRELLRAEREHRRSHTGYLQIFIGWIMIGAIALSHSRAAWIVAALILFAWILCELFTPWLTRQRPRWVMLGMLVIPLVVAGIALATQSESNLRIQFLTLISPVEAFDSSGRFLSMESTLRILTERPWFGVGAGTFDVAFPAFQDPNLPGFWRYAHNDWLQYLVELGVVGSLLLLALLVVTLGPNNIASMFNPRRMCRRPLFRAAVIALAGLGLHALVDFPLHIPSIAFLAVWLAAVLTVLRETKLT